MIESYDQSVLATFIFPFNKLANHKFYSDAGHVDPGENDLETAIRETEEEAGLKPGEHFTITEFRRELHVCNHNN